MRKFEIEDHKYKVFCIRYGHVPFFIPEDNRVMASSYSLLNKYMRFLDKGEGVMKESENLLDVGVEEALKQVRWDRKSFFERGGVYEWSEEMGTSEEKGGRGCVMDEEVRERWIGRV